MTSLCDPSELALELRIVSDLTGLMPEQVKAAGYGAREQPVAYDADWVTEVEDDLRTGRSG